MSIKVMTNVWDGYPGSGSELIAMLALADWCSDDGGSLYPSIKAVSEKVRVSTSQARRILRKFESEGYLQVVGNHGGGAPGTTRNYHLNVDMLERLAAEANAEKKRLKETGGASATPGMDAREGLHPCARRVAPVRETTGTHASLTTIEPSEEPSGKHQSRTETPKPGKFDASAALINMGVPPKVAYDWLAVRKLKKAAVTETALDGMIREAAKAGLSLDEALRMCCERGWAGFKASWVAQTNSNAPAGRQAAVEARNSQAGAEFVAEIMGGEYAR